MSRLFPVLCTFIHHRKASCLFHYITTIHFVIIYFQSLFQSTTWSSFHPRALHAVLFRHSFSSLLHTTRSYQSFPTLPSLFCSVFRVILFSYSHSFVCIYICHISLIQFSISSYHLFFISQLCSYSIFYNLYKNIFSDFCQTIAVLFIRLEPPRVGIYWYFSRKYL